MPRKWHKAVVHNRALGTMNRDKSLQRHFCFTSVQSPHGRISVHPRRLRIIATQLGLESMAIEIQTPSAWNRIPLGKVAMV